MSEIKIVKVKGVRAQADALCDVRDEFDDESFALAKHLEVCIDTISLVAHCTDTYESTDAPGEYLVIEDHEAEEQWDAQLEDYIDQCILPEVSENARGYFDREAWKNDAQIDGRGHSLSGYDGCEHEETINGTTYYIYRTN